MEITKDFPILNSNIVYLDSAATSQKAKASYIDEINKYYLEYCSKYRQRGNYAWARKANKKVEETRKKLQKFINAKKMK